MVAMKGMDAMKAKAGRWHDSGHGRPHEANRTPWPAADSYEFALAAAKAVDAMKMKRRRQWAAAQGSAIEVHEFEASLMAGVGLYDPAHLGRYQRHELDEFSPDFTDMAGVGLMTSVKDTIAPEESDDGRCHCGKCRHCKREAAQGKAVNAMKEAIASVKEAAASVKEAIACNRS